MEIKMDLNHRHPTIGDCFFGEGRPTNCVAGFVCYLRNLQDVGRKPIQQDQNRCRLQCQYQTAAHSQS